MGVWSFHIFGSDQDLDILGGLSDDLGVETLFIPENLTTTREKLNDSRLATKFHALKSENPPRVYRIIMLGAAAMSVGATLPKEFLEYLKEVYPTSNLFAEGKAQMKLALKEYKNDGTVWDFKKNEGVVEEWMRERPGKFLRGGGDGLH